MGYDWQNDDPADDPRRNEYAGGGALTRSNKKKFHLTVWDGESLWHEEFHGTLGGAVREAQSIERKKVFRCKVVEVRTGKVRFPQ